MPRTFYSRVNKPTFQEKHMLSLFNKKKKYTSYAIELKPKTPNRLPKCTIKTTVFHFQV
jgi:hypothetical protein